MNGVDVLRAGYNHFMDIFMGVMADVTQEMADEVPPEKANPIGYTCLHLLTSNDWMINVQFLGQSTLWERDGWGEQLGIERPNMEGETPREWVESVQVPLDGLADYAEAVREAGNAYLDALQDEDLDQELEMPPPYKTLGEVFETFINWHIAAHTGEIAALKGTQGKTGYGF